jgi:phosphoglycolate phosphatase
LRQARYLIPLYRVRAGSSSQTDAMRKPGNHSLDERIFITRAMNYITLFDIDKTLIARSRAHFNAFLIALKQVYGVELEPVMTRHGTTDQMIIRDMLTINGVGDATIDAGLDQCMKVMIDKFMELNRADTITLCPGVVELLTELDKRGAYRGLVTGNLEPIAWAKLEKAGLRRFFTFGGFGSDYEDRNKMAALALRRCSDLHGPQVLSHGRVVLFGDTPYDVRAAKSIGALAVAVSTGHPSKDELRDAGADVVLDDLADLARVLSLVFDA